LLLVMVLLQKHVLVVETGALAHHLALLVIVLVAVALVVVAEVATKVE
jgi:hypothetical protein